MDILILVENNRVLISETNYGKGYVLAVADPLLCNEFIDHLILPNDFENTKVTGDLAEHLLTKTHKSTKCQN